MSMLRAAVVAAAVSLVTTIIWLKVGLPTMWWPVASFASAVIGYIGYDPARFRKDVAHAIRLAWMNVYEAFTGRPVPVAYTGWVKRAAWWKMYANSMNQPVWWVMSMFIGAGVGPMIFFTELRVPYTPLGIIPAVVVGQLVISLFFMTLITCLDLLPGVPQKQGAFFLKKSESRARQYERVYRRRILRYNPMMAYPLLVRYLVLRAIPRAVRFIWRSIVITYEFTVSQYRIATAIGAALGTGIGIAFAAPVIGAIAGGIVGLALAAERRRRPAYAV